MKLKDLFKSKKIIKTETFIGMVYHRITYTTWVNIYIVTKNYKREYNAGFACL